jgi:hypothetical protein
LNPNPHITSEWQADIYPGSRLKAVLAVTPAQRMLPLMAAVKILPYFGNVAKGLPGVYVMAIGVDTVHLTACRRFLRSRTVFTRSECHFAGQSKSTFG